MNLPTFHDTDEGLVATFPHDSISNRLQMRAAQLDSLMTIMTGDDNFSMFADQVQGDLLWLVRSLSEEIRQLVDAQLSVKVQRYREQTQHSVATTPGQIWAEINAMSDRELDIAAQGALARAHEPVEDGDLAAEVSRGAPDLTIAAQAMVSRSRTKGARNERREVENA